MSPENERMWRIAMVCVSATVLIVLVMTVLEGRL